MDVNMSNIENGGHPNSPSDECPPGFVDQLTGLNGSVAGSSSSTPRSVLVQHKDLSCEAFYAQAVLIYIICIACVVNLSIGSDHAGVFIALLSGSLGVLLPSPRISRQKRNMFYDLVHENKQREQ